MASGYVKIYRKITESVVFQDDLLFRLWVFCLLKASHKKTSFMMNGVSLPIEIEAGQFVTGRESLWSEFYFRKKQKANGVSQITLWRKLKILEKLQNLNIKTTNKYSIITITNWNEYQCNEQQMNNNRTTDEQQLITYNNDKEQTKKKHTISKNSENILFNLFWAAYPRKVSKADAVKAWNKINPDETLANLIVLKVDENKNSNNWLKDDGQFIPYPATWLNKRRWEDEVIPCNSCKKDKLYSEFD